MNFKYLFLQFLVFILFVSYSGVSIASDRVYKNVKTGPILIVNLTITSSAQTVIAVKKNINYPGVVDPVIYLWNNDTNQFYDQNDDWGLLNVPNSFNLCLQPAQTQSACLIGNYPPGNYKLIVHAWSESFTGNVDVFQDSNLMVVNKLISGKKLTVASTSNANQPYTYEAVPAPLAQNETGTVDTVMLGLDQYGGLVIWNDDAVHLRSRFTKENVKYVVVGSYSSLYNSYDSVKLHLYVNDTYSDADNDMVGDLLEQELGLCHEYSSPYCLIPKDTDNDGLTDSEELFGYNNSPHQYLPRWGANPLQKDLFVEVDYSDNISTNPMTLSQVNLIASFFGGGSANDLNNPNLQSGIRVHLDIGLNPSLSNQMTTVPYGDFGGSNSFPDSITAKEVDNGKIHNDYMNPIREFKFLHASLYADVDHTNIDAIIKSECAGYAGGPRWVRMFVRDDGVFSGVVTPGSDTKEEICARSFAHEIGHLLLLTHGGNSYMSFLQPPYYIPPVTDVVGAGGNPLYHSIMSYSFDRTAKTFLKKPLTTPLNPKLLIESNGIGLGLDPFQLLLPATTPPNSGYLSHPDEFNLVTFFFQGVNAYTPVDWDRSLRVPGEVPGQTMSSVSVSDFTSTEIRYPVTLSNGSRSSGTFLQNISDIDQSPISPNSPSIIRYSSGSNKRLFSFYVKNGSIYYASTPYVSVPNSTGSCVLGDNLNTQCSVWSSPSQTVLSDETVVSARSVTSIFIFGHIYLAYTDNSDHIFLIRSNTVDANGNITWLNPEPVLAAGANAETQKVPELSHVRIGANLVLGLFYTNNPLNIFHWHTKVNSGSPLVHRGPLRDSLGNMTAGRFSPSVFHWPGPFVNPLVGQTCGLFPRRQVGTPVDLLRMMCLDFNDASPNPGWTEFPNAFQELSTAFPVFQQNVYGKTTLLFRTYRNSDGTHMDPINYTGQFWLIRNSNNSQKSVPPYTFPLHPHEVHFSKSISLPTNHQLVSGQSYFLKDSFSLKSSFYFGTSVSAYIDSELASIKAVGFRVGDPENTFYWNLDFFPFFDGTFEANFRADSDFRIMEGGLCRALRGIENTTDCLSTSQTRWGY